MPSKIDDKRQAWGGRQADVTPAILNERIVSQGTQVAMKKLRYGDNTDDEKLSKVLRL
ncbi:hypothetical protein FRC04_006944 [Tulasnella sp. 424]|nr:hypothetical protein FRC04_006944 [Tulasnella sp. 424]